MVFKAPSSSSSSSLVLFAFTLTSAFLGGEEQTSFLPTARGFVVQSAPAKLVRGQWQNKGLEAVLTQDTFFNSPTSSSSITHPLLTSLAGTPLERAREIGTVMFQDVVGPIFSCLLTQGPAADWDSFWRRETPCSTTQAADYNNNNDSNVNNNNKNNNSSPKTKKKTVMMTNAEHVATAMEHLGPTYVKFGQALSSRQDLVPEPLAEAFSRLTDDMAPFDTFIARDIIRQELARSTTLTLRELSGIMESISEEPVAAASIGQVYQAHIPGRGKVALKVQRPNIRYLVEQDANLLRQIATWVEALPSLPGSTPLSTGSGSGNTANTNPQQQRLVATKIVDAADEFMSRVLEELDYTREARNMETFAKLYSHRNGKSASIGGVRLVVPKVYTDLCTDKLLVMEWIDGCKLSTVATEDDSTLKENLTLIQSGIAATLSQLLESGTMHADPHAGNLLKVQTEEGLMLGLLDYGLLGTVPESVRDALVCAVAQVVFARDAYSVADLFGELKLLPQHVLDDPTERDALAHALERIFDDVLVYPEKPVSEANGATTTDAQHDEHVVPPVAVSAVPKLKFDKLLGGLSLLVSRFSFTLPEYFANIARALATLEGIALKLDPDFNAMQAVYPYALNRILQNPSMSPIVEDTLTNLMRDKQTGKFDGRQIKKLVQDVAVFGGTSRRKVAMDLLRSKSGRRIGRKVGREIVRDNLNPRRLQRRQERKRRRLTSL